MGCPKDVYHPPHGTLFFVPRFVLRKTSGYFAATLELAQAGLETYAIPMDEPRSLLILALCILCGLAPTLEDAESCDLGNMDIVEKLFALSQRWDAPALASRARDAITSLPLAEKADPIRLYGLAMRAGWDELAKKAAQRTLVLSIFNFDDECIQQQLGSISAPALLRLYALHRKRRDVLDRMLRGRLSGADLERGTRKTLDEALVMGRCTKCGEVAATAKRLWAEYCSRIFTEMDVRPLGDTVVGSAVDEWSEALACWNARCVSGGCTGEERLFDREQILVAINSCIAALPKDL
ncbi:hypothetical protein C8F01DRAFT_1102164 [Mycena amicta]|nr:hypothetical protein C8F01DRAFT_1102164 [Mycena amicta]